MKLFISICCILFIFLSYQNTLVVSQGTSEGADNGDPSAPCVLPECAEIEPNQIGIQLYTGDKPAGIRFALYPKIKPTNPGILQSGDTITNAEWTRLWTFWTENCPRNNAANQFNENCMKDSGTITNNGRTVTWNWKDRTFYWYVKKHLYTYKPTCKPIPLSNLNTHTRTHHIIHSLKCGVSQVWIKWI